jgi:2-phosphosulfolactate phosphatase
MNNIKVCLTPSLFPIYSDRTSVVVVVDVLRATSAICTALELGVESILPVSTIEDALDYKDNDEYIIAAERNGKIVRGFDLGNSPTEYFNHSLVGKKMVLTTTNGTKAINIAKQDHLVVTGSFLNLKALSSFLVEMDKGIIILCAGWKNDYCLEDTLFAGALTEQLIKNDKFYYDNDSTASSLMLYEKSKENLFDFLKDSQHRKRLAHLGIENDIRYCLELNKSEVIPILKDNVLISHS